MSNATAGKLTNGDTNTTHKITLKRLTEMQLKGDQIIFIIALRDRMFFKIECSSEMIIVLPWPTLNSQKYREQRIMP